MRVKIAGKYYDLEYADLGGDFGLCDPPTDEAKRIRIKHNHKSDLEELDSTIHECMHAAQWWLDEEYVRRFSEDFAAVLWRLGWRKTGG